ncbi:LysM peptidoglycan-binding domain-containing protein [Arthrobacter citreus]|nr:LysM peptidoglycan-binding domain-containing protein [Arthrobacter citreus]
MKKSIKNVILSTAIVFSLGTVVGPANAASVTYKVKKGDTLYKISKSYKTTVTELKKQNKLKSNSIRIGQKLYIPVKAKVAPKKPATQTISSVKLPASESVKKMALEITSWYETSSSEADAFGTTSGNFDGQGLSFGALQENFGTNTIQPIMKNMFNNHNDIVLKAFNGDTDSYNTFKDVIMNKTTKEQVAWGDSITDPKDKYQVIEPWKTYFKNLGTSKECIDEQINASKWYFDQAEKYYQTFGLWTKRGYALMFDIFVQSGAISDKTKNLILDDFKKIDTKNLTKEQIETKKMNIIVNRRAADVNQQWRDTWKSRKSVIANGSGTVVGYGDFFDVTPYGATLTHVNK